MEATVYTIQVHGPTGFGFHKGLGFRVLRGLLLRVYRGLGFRVYIASCTKLNMDQQGLVSIRV